MASAAMTQLDADGNGAISAEEAASAPGLAAGFSRADADSDGQLTADEIAERIKTIVKISPAIVNFVVELSSTGKPVENAKVTVIADDFLGDQFPQGSGTTDEDGIAPIWMAAEDLPFDDSPNGMRPGLYRIDVERDGKKVSPKTAGVELSMDSFTLRTSTFKVEL